MMKIISICNQKGGVGKTTTAINLSASLSQKGFKVLLIDIDPQANATSGLGARKNLLPKNIYHVLLEQVSIDEIIKPTKINNLYLAPSNLELIGARIELITALGREQKLKKAVEATKQLFDFVFIDCPPSLGILTINSLVVSNSALIPLQCEYYAMEGLSQLFNAIELIKQNLNPPLTIEGVLLTMADYRTRLTGEVIEEARRFLKDKVYNTIVPRSVRLSEAPGHGEPIMSYDKNSQGALSYNQLAEEFILRNSKIYNKLEQKKPEETKEEAVQTEANKRLESSVGEKRGIGENSNRQHKG
ncbi:MAG: ParA family protein [Candidatus Omnitrophota bacterium]|nr:MAG: ParA family protein [Candidatus Omnitrophota bacterium]